ncbi:MAG: DinB family protein [Thermomicrobiales bacterium]
MSSILAEMFRHNLWANLRIIDTCADVDDSVLDASTVGALGSIRETLVHIVGAEASYGLRVTGGEPPAPPAETISLADLRALAIRNGERLIAAAEQADMDRVLEGTWRGEPYAILLSTFLIQAINHGTDHRSQIATTLTQQGVEPPRIDGWTYNDHKSRKAPV